MKRYRQCNGVKFQKNKHRCTNTTQKPKDRRTWTPLRTERQRRWTGTVSSCCPASGTRNVTIVTDSSIMWLIRYICYFIFVELVFAYHNNCVTKKYYYVRVCDSPFFIAITVNTISYIGFRQVIRAHITCLCFIFPESKAREIYNSDRLYEPVLPV